MSAKLAERGNDDEFPCACHHRLMLELPSVLVWDVDGVESDLHRGIDVAARTVADHPALRLYDFVLAHEAGVSLGIFFAYDLDELKKSLQAGAFDLGSLLGGLAFCEQN